MENMQKPYEPASIDEVLDEFFNLCRSKGHKIVFQNDPVPSLNIGQVNPSQKPARFTNG
jgi:hypothetical protein